MPRLQSLVRGRRSRPGSVAQPATPTTPRSASASVTSVVQGTGVLSSPNSPSAPGSSRYDFTFQHMHVAGPNPSRMYPPSSSFLEPDPNATTSSLFLDPRDDQSLSESVLDYPEEFGRTYTAFRSGAYLYPNDQMEMARSEAQYYFLNQVANGSLHFAPWTRAQPPLNVLDVATGNGLWAIDFADMFPESRVQGNDLCPIQPSAVPPNVHFFVEDAEETWHYSEPFDYIHVRFCLGSFIDYNKTIIQQSLDNLTPGGWLECQEIEATAFSDDNTLLENSALATWGREICEATQALNRSLDIAPHLTSWMEAAGFVDVQEVVYKIPCNTWPRSAKYKELGRQWEHIFREGLGGFSYMPMNRYFGRSKEEIEAGLTAVRRDVSDRSIHAYHKYRVVIGRKPFEGELERRQKVDVVMEES